MFTNPYPLFCPYVKRKSVLGSTPLAGVATVFGLFPVGFAEISKRLERKVTKHEKIYALALEKQNSVSELVSKALADKKISDSEFAIILRVVEKYHELKAEIRNGEKKKHKDRKQRNTNTKY